MIRFYSLFVTDDELLASPYIRRFNTLHDLTLNRGKTETINFLLQTPLTDKQKSKLNVLFDPISLNLTKIDVKSFEHQALITVTLTPKELGSLKIGFAFPQTEELHRDHVKKIPSPFISIPCDSLRNSRLPVNSNKLRLLHGKKGTHKVS